MKKLGRTLSLLLVSAVLTGTMAVNTVRAEPLEGTAWVYPGTDLPHCGGDGGIEPIPLGEDNIVPTNNGNDEGYPIGETDLPHCGGDGGIEPIPLGEDNIVPYNNGNDESYPIGETDLPHCGGDGGIEPIPVCKLPPYEGDGGIIPIPLGEENIIKPDNATVAVSSDNTSVTVSNDQPCVVYAKLSDGTYQRMEGSKLGDNRYSYDIAGKVNGSYSLVVAKMGDVDGDGNIDVSDIAQLIRAKQGSFTQNALEHKMSDVNGDGSIDVSDIAQLIRCKRAGAEFPMAW